MTPDLDLRPAMTVRATLALVKRIPAGAGVSYGHTWVADRDTTVGVVPAGYGEGIPRAAGNRVEVWAGGAPAPGTRPGLHGPGRRSTSATTRSSRATTSSSSGPGTAGEPTAQDWAEALDTINYEIVTRVGGRLARRHVDGGPA